MVDKESLKRYSDYLSSGYLNKPIDYTKYVSPSSKLKKIKEDRDKKINDLLNE